MKILQVCPRYYPCVGGVETHVEEISKRLVDKGFKVSISTTDSSGKLPKEEIIGCVEVRRFKSWAPNEAYGFSRELRKYLIENSDSFDVVHAHSYHAFAALYAAQAKNRNKMVFTPHYHGTGHTFFRSLLHIPYKFFGKRIFEKADKVICVSNYEKGLVLKFGVNEEKIVVIPNGVSLQEFKGLKKRDSNRKSRVILCVARLEKYKGVHYLVKVLQKLNSDIVLEVVGEGPFKENLLRLVEDLGVKDRVTFFQNLPRNELLQKYADADVFALLSKHEAYGIGIAEALRAGTPCIVANASALKEWVDGENCFGIDVPINLDLLRNLITEVMGRHVSKVKVFDWDEIVEKTIQVYKYC
jgi:glycosyltransferase involved in cell wall biosynthesis